MSQPEKKAASQNLESRTRAQPAKPANAAENNKQKEPAISIVLAAYNGEAYLPEQLASILKQMAPADELILSIDPSQDQTQAIAERIRQENPDRNIVLLDGPGQGVIANFENGLRQAANPVIALCDQDDVWLENKLDVLRGQFADPKLMGLVHDAMVCDGSLNMAEPSYFNMHHSRPGFRNNLIRNSFIGCCMALRKEVIEKSLPFPTPIPMHDQFLGLQACRMGKVLFINEVLLKYRRHEGNVSSLKPSSIYSQIAWRLQILRALSRRPV